MSTSTGDNRDGARALPREEEDRPLLAASYITRCNPIHDDGGQACLFGTAICENLNCVREILWRDEFGHESAGNLRNESRERYAAVADQLPPFDENCGESVSAHPVQIGEANCIFFSAT